MRNYPVDASHVKVKIDHLLAGELKHKKGIICNLQRSKS